MAGSGYKLFASGEVLTAANLQSYAIDQSTMVFASSAARTTALAAPSEGMVSYLTDTNSVEVYDGSAWKRVYNTTGSVLQVVYQTYNTLVTNNTSTYADTGITATITPYSTSSKILVMVAQLGLQKSPGNAANECVIQLLRGSTQIGLSYFGYTGTALTISGSTNFVILDSPSTTSATTYKTQIKNGFNGAAAYAQAAASTSSIALMEIAA